MRYPHRIIHLLKIHKCISILLYYNNKPWMYIRVFLSECIFRQGYITIPWKTKHVCHTCLTYMKQQYCIYVCMFAYMSRPFSIYVAHFTYIEGIFYPCTALFLHICMYCTYTIYSENSTYMHDCRIYVCSQVLKKANLWLPYMLFVIHICPTLTYIAKRNTYMAE